MKQAVRDALLAAGVSGAQLAELEAKYPSRSRVRINTTTCPACGAKPTRFDYACGACSEVKVRSERRFWQYADDRVEGMEGRPKQKKARKQTLPPQRATVERPIIVALPEEIAPPCKPEMHEFLVTIGYVGLVIVAQYPYLAVREARLAIRAGETTGHSILEYGRVDAEPSHYRDFWTDEENRAAEEADAKKN